MLKLSSNISKSFMFILVALLLSTSAFAQVFEGKISIKFSDPKGKSPAVNMEYFVKNKLGRINFTQQGMSMSVIVKNKKVSIIIDAMNAYMEMPDKADKDSAMGLDDSKIIKTNETKEILGYKTTRWNVIEKADTTILWVTDKLGSFLLADALGQDDPSMSKMSAAFGENFFPMEIAERGKDGKIVTLYSVIEVKPMTVDLKYFEIPEGYQKMDPQGMGGN